MDMGRTRFTMDEACSRAVTIAFVSSISAVRYTAEKGSLTGARAATRLLPTLR